MRLPEVFPPLFFGAAISLALFGIVVLQTWNYFNNFHKDNLLLKAFVLTLFSLDLTSSIFVAMWCYRVFVTNWADESFLGVLHWTLVMDPIFVGIISAFVQVFFAIRIHVLLGRWWVSMLIYILAATTLCGGVGSGIASLKVGIFSRLPEIKAFFAVWLWPAAVADIIIVLSMSYYLYQHKERISNTEKTMDRTVGIMVQNGLVTALLALTQAILFQSTSTPYHIGISFVMPKIYAIMALSSLHSRKVIVRPEVVAVPSVGGPAFTTSTNNAGVFVNVETTETRDYTLKEDWDTISDAHREKRTSSPSSVSSIRGGTDSSPAQHAW